jgi:hypothetical protein
MRVLSVSLVAWLLAATWIGASGTFYRATPVEVALTVWIGSIGLLLAVWRVQSAREWAVNGSIRGLLVPHVVRFVGLAFVALYARGDLPFSVGIVGGIGDVVVAIGAIVLMLDPDQSWRTWWNIVGFIDIVSVVVSVLREGLRDPHSVAVIREFPLSLLPTYFVPLIIASHCLIFVRFRSDRARRQAPPPISDSQRSADRGVHGR